MKLVTFEKHGKKHKAYVPELTDTLSAGGAVDDNLINPEYGIPADPPDIESMDWDAIKCEIHNVLVDNGLMTWLDVQSTPVGFTPALSVLKRYLIRLYRDQDKV